MEELSKLGLLPPQLKLKILSSLSEETRESASGTDSKVALESSPHDEEKAHAVEEETKLLAALHSEACRWWTTAELQALDQQGYIIKDSFLKTLLEGDETKAKVTVEDVRKDCVASLKGGKLRHANMKGQIKWEDKGARGDLIAWLHLDDNDLPNNVKMLLHSLHELCNELDRVCEFGTKRTQIQMAYYHGNGARYVRHMDAYPGGPKRRLTMLYYANPDWQPEHGGCLRLYLGDKTEDVPPKGDRLVVFNARTIPHEVLASYAERFSITMWLY